jgi:hypothetical protein
MLRLYMGRLGACNTDEAVLIFFSFFPPSRFVFNGTDNRADYLKYGHYVFSSLR